jgi:hypothetical protein
MNEDENMLVNEFSSQVGLEKESFFKKNKKLLIAGISGVLLIIIIIIIIIAVSSSKSSSDNGNETEGEGDTPKRNIDSYGQIKCIYNAQNFNTILLGKEFTKNFDFDLSID